MRLVRFATGKLRSLRLMISADIVAAFLSAVDTPSVLSAECGFSAIPRSDSPVSSGLVSRFGRAFRRRAASVRRVRGHRCARVRGRRLDRRDAGREPNGHRPCAGARDRDHPDVLPRMGDHCDGGGSARDFQVDRGARNRLHDHARHPRSRPRTGSNRALRGGLGLSDGSLLACAAFPHALRAEGEGDDLLPQRAR
jgi:hypothetical protein